MKGAPAKKAYAGRVAVVTGAASGIGRALCLRLARSGAETVLVDTDVKRARELAAVIAADGGRSRAFEADVSKVQELRTIVDKTLQMTHRIDYMFNNAGLEINGELLTVDPRKWQIGFEIDIVGVILGSLAVYPSMLERGSGHIVNTSSLAGLIPLPGLSYYCAAKHAVVGFSLSLRAEARSKGVRVSVACPSLVQTDIRANTAAYLGREPTGASRLAWPKPTSAGYCAEAILAGVCKNKAVIPVPRYASWLWLLYRLSPRLFLAISNYAFTRSPLLMSPPR